MPVYGVVLDGHRPGLEASRTVRPRRRADRGGGCGAPWASASIFHLGAPGFPRSRPSSRRGRRGWCIAINAVATAVGILTHPAHRPGAPRAAAPRQRGQIRRPASRPPGGPWLGSSPAALAAGPALLAGFVIGHGRGRLRASLVVAVGPRRRVAAARARCAARAQWRSSVLAVASLAATARADAARLVLLVPARPRPGDHPRRDRPASTTRDRGGCPTRHRRRQAAARSSAPHRTAPSRMMAVCGAVIVASTRPGPRAGAHGRADVAGLRPRTGRAPPTVIVPVRLDRGL